MSAIDHITRFMSDTRPDIFPEAEDAEKFIDNLDLDDGDNVYHGGFIFHFTGDELVVSLMLGQVGLEEGTDWTWMGTTLEPLFKI